MLYLMTIHVVFDDNSCCIFDPGGKGSALSAAPYARLSIMTAGWVAGDHGSWLLSGWVNYHRETLKPSKKAKASDEYGRGDSASLCVSSSGDDSVICGPRSAPGGPGPGPPPPAAYFILNGRFLRAFHQKQA